MKVHEIRIQQVGASKDDPTWLAAIFQILISLEEFDGVETDAERIALVDQIISAIHEVRE